MSITQKCSIEGCNNPFKGLGYCDRHYHEFCRTKEYNAWLNMKSRCYNRNKPEYKNYGGRGIIVCDEWKHDFPAFHSYIGNRPSPNHSLDRINNNGNYEPGNVKWSTRLEQRLNQRMRINNTVGVVGVYWYPKNKKWSPQIRVAGKTIYMGLFENIEDAIAVRKEAETKYGY